VVPLDYESHPPKLKQKKAGFWPFVPIQVRCRLAVALPHPNAKDTAMVNFPPALGAIPSTLNAVRPQDGLAGLQGKLGKPGAAGVPGVASGGFGEAFKTALQNVSAAQNKSSELQTQFQLGNKNVSLEETMLAMQKSQIGFQAALHVRNRMMQAYTDVMNMQV
jgi:flagellar hook-basal body complex protein FliE